MGELESDPPSSFTTQQQQQHLTERSLHPPTHTLSPHSKTTEETKKFLLDKDAADVIQIDGMRVVVDRDPETQTLSCPKCRHSGFPDTDELTAHLSSNCSTSRKSSGSPSPSLSPASQDNQLMYWLLHPVIGYVAFEILRSLLVEGMFAWSPVDRQPWLDTSLLVLLMECAKLLIAFCVVLATTRNFSLQYLACFVVQAFLYFINNFLYFQTVQWTSAATISILLHLRLPITGVLHHFTMRKQTAIGWGAMFAAYLGVVVSQLNDDLSFGSFWPILMCLIIAVNSSIASIVNEKMLKTLDMPFWDQQLRLYALGALSSAVFVFARKDALVHPEAYTPGILGATIGAIVTGAAAGIVTGLVVYKLDSVIKLISQAVITVLVTIAVFFVFGTFRGSVIYFSIGAAILVAATYVYARAAASAPKTDAAYAPLDPKATPATTTTTTGGLSSWTWKGAALALLLFVFGLQQVLILGTIDPKSGDTFVAPEYDPNVHRCSVDPREYLDKFKGEDSYTVVRDIDQECALATPEALGNCTVPKVLHLVMFGGHFKMHHYLAMRSMNDRIKPEKFFIHGSDFPVGQELFDKAMKDFNPILIQSRNMSAIYHNKIGLVEHKSDVLRLESVIRFGGMYFDLDVFLLKDLDAFLNNEATMGAQAGAGINNGMIIGKRCARFLVNWYRQYHTFDDAKWDDHSVRLPGRLYESDHRGLILESKALHNDWPCDFCFTENHDPEIWKPIRAVHSFFRSYDKEHTFEEFKTINNNYGRLVRNLLYDGPPLDEPMPNNTNPVHPENATHSETHTAENTPPPPSKRRRSVDLTFLDAIAA
ncbi:hypothetical protein HDU96_001283 [Phlyctochytrium bullatum]|nr:hypothetical protein HDU96_001283 [Phlyctochytrium bullatum]